MHVGAGVAFWKTWGTSGVFTSRRLEHLFLDHSFLRVMLASLTAGRALMALSTWSDLILVEQRPATEGFGRSVRHAPLEPTGRELAVITIPLDPLFRYAVARMTADAKRGQRRVDIESMDSCDVHVPAEELIL